MMLLEDVQKIFGSGVVAASVRKEEHHKLDWVDTGNYTLNKCICRLGKGLPTGNIVESYGDSATGKSVFGLHCLKDTQQQDGIAVLIDTEGAFEPDFAEKVGIDLDQLIYIGPTIEVDGVERALTVFDVMPKTEKLLNLIHEQYGRDKLVTILWDSLGGTSFLEDVEKEQPKETQGRPEKRIKHWIKRIRPIVNNSNTLWLIINQVYSVIASYNVAEQEKAPGGKAVKFNSQIRIKWILREGKAGKVFDKNDIPVGARLHFFIKKNRKAPPWRSGYMEFLFNEDGGVTLDYYSGYADYLLQREAVKAGRGKLEIGEDSYRKKQAQGKYCRCEFMEKMLEEHPELLEV